MKDFWISVKMQTNGRSDFCKDSVDIEGEIFEMENTTAHAVDNRSLNYRKYLLQPFEICSTNICRPILIVTSCPSMHNMYFSVMLKG